eukprot:CAMPEP_0117760162 /NCGR_PEP_ID=MMETSP0947-20121206/16439_1 /TAXON_ID=44440 /ORGANISM="Chattonella subsalsa, Strain CCMP2191" /LENGTH=862 /DNA_ID=CAMNT_0005580747 /DNA_START=163 /DNA_END=2751 /DNA_ORIENTATION=+
MILSTVSRQLFQGKGLAPSTLQRKFWMSSPAAASASIATKFDHLKIEKKWQDYWEKNKTFKAVRREGKEKKYILDMFPYPSGAGLHVGHPEGYTASDIMSRYYRMKDFDVLHPMGWDSFGLPAEQHAINTGTHPRETTLENIANFKRQLKSLGFAFDWDREVATTDTDYVKWTQWIFLKLFEKDLAAQSEVLVNWCPALGTVLANEEVIDGLSERGSHPVKRLPLRQWVFKITEYADELEAGLENADLQWPEGTRAAQKAWIGKSVGATITFDVAGSEGDEQFSVFTTRPDTVLGVSYVVLAPEHPLVEKITTDDQRAAVQAYVEETASKSDMDRTAVGKEKAKTGVPTGAFAIHPLSGEQVPIWVADYVLGSYGTGAVMAVPGHDERDYEFAKNFDLPIKQVVKPTKGEANLEEAAFTDYGVSVNSGKFDGLSTEDCKAAIIKELEEIEKGGATITYKLRDWVFSRQRYWGEPIPIYFPVTMEDPNGDPRKDDAHTIDFDTPIPVKEEDLPLTLPEMDDFKPGDDPAGCLARAKDWRYFQEDGQWYARETNTMPQWAGSCWYYFRYIDNLNSEQAWSAQADEDWMPVDLYVGGQEHAVLHLLYARFWHKVLFDLGYTKHPEPFQKLVHQGMILGSDNEKMSKSRGNVVNPDDVVQESGADSLRLYEMFMGPLEATKPWQTSQVSGVVRFRDRIYNLANRPLSDDMDDETCTLMHKTIKKVTEDIEVLSFNTAIAQMMVFSNHLASNPNPSREAIETLTLLASPFAPHVAEECWEIIGKSQGTIANEPWPVYDEALCVDAKVTMAIQVNGKVRAKMELAPDADEKTATEIAMAEFNVQKFLEGKEVKKIIYRPGKIMNIVAK